MKAPLIWLALVAALMSGTAASASDQKSTIAPGARYVAMGSSFAAGPGLGHPKPGTPARCTRSPVNYATLLAVKLKLDLIDASCSAATTAHILGPWAELPAQLDAVTPDTQLVTVTIGGNDVGYVMKLMTASCASGNASCPKPPETAEADWVKLEGNLHAIARQVHARAPAARLVFVDYVTLLPANGSCTAAPLSPVSAATLRVLGQRLAKVTAKVARQEHADLLPAGKLSHRHTPCDAQPWSVGTLGTAPGVPWHPNAAGHAAIAAQLERMLRR